MLVFTGVMVMIIPLWIAAGLAVMARFALGGFGGVDAGGAVLMLAGAVVLLALVFLVVPVTWSIGRRLLVGVVGAIVYTGIFFLIAPLIL